MDEISRHARATHRYDIVDTRAARRSPKDRLKRISCLDVSRAWSRTREVVQLWVSHHDPTCIAHRDRGLPPRVPLFRARTYPSCRVCAAPRIHVAVAISHPM